MNRDHANGARFVRDSAAGHYESWFQRANHSERPLAFWNRSTVFSPRGRPKEAIGELWAVWFDGEANEIVAVREEVPIAKCSFARSGLDVTIGDARLEDGALAGSASLGDRVVRWDLRYEAGGDPLLLLPEYFYDAGFPKAKGLVGTPNALFNGTIEVNGVAHSVDGWMGSQNHNWGSRQTDQYGWAQVAGFDNAKDSFLECITGRARISTRLPIWIPTTSLVVLRHEGRTHALNDPWTALRARGSHEVGDLHIASRSKEVEIDVHVSAPKSAFVGLTYRNPPGGIKICHNTKLARCEVRLRVDGSETTLTTENRAAFEVLSDKADGVRVVA